MAPRPIAPFLAAAGPAWSYPVVPAISVPTTRHKVRGLMVAAAVLVVLAASVTAITVWAWSQRPEISYCTFSCGTQIGPRLYSRRAYVSSQFGYRVEYSAPFTLADVTSSGVEISGNADNYMVFKATSGDNINAAMQSAVNSLSPAHYQDLRPVGAPVNGAEIGYVAGNGAAYTGNFVDANANLSQPITVVVMASSEANLTISVLTVGTQDLSSYENVPLGLKFGEYFDFQISNTIWPAAP
ncbi:MAG TPA: hypothetical protein VME46_21620 [Acidimicrobiales bacterium]|nr:hypothetical protein [Acidimicrobiales bacterium]